MSFSRAQIKFLYDKRRTGHYWQSQGEIQNRILVDDNDDQSAIVARVCESYITDWSKYYMVPFVSTHVLVSIQLFFFFGSCCFLLFLLVGLALFLCSCRKKYRLTARHVWPSEAKTSWLYNRTNASTWGIQICETGSRAMSELWNAAFHHTWKQWQQQQTKNQHWE